MSSDQQPDELDESGPDSSDDELEYDPEEDQDSGATNTAPPGLRPTDPEQTS